MSEAPDILFICGMHRSGTSLLAEACHLAGLSVSDDRVPDDRQVNHRGFWEDRRVVEINDRLLETLGLHWSSVGSMPSDWTQQPEVEALMTQASAHLQSIYAEQLPAVIKDPRLCRLLPFWIKATEHCRWSAGCLLALRDPQAVADSLYKRDRLPVLLSALLWSVYMQESVVNSTSLPRQFIDYDTLLEGGPAVLLSVLAEFGFPAPETTDALHPAFDRTLRHHQISDSVSQDEVMQHARSLYQQYIDASPGPPASPATEIPVTDDVRAVIDALSTALREAHGEQMRIGRLHEQALAVIGEQNEQLAQRNRDCEHAESLVRQRDKDLQSAAREREAFQEQLQKHIQAIQWSDQEREQAAQYIDTLEQKIRQRDEDLQSAAREREIFQEQLQKHIQAIQWSDKEREQAAQYIDTLEQKIRTQDAILTALRNSLPGRIALHWQKRKISIQRDGND